MTASIMPLDGKYYGTKIETPYGRIEVWFGSGEPSEREMAQWPKPSPENGTAEEIRSDMMCDGHYEDAMSYRVAEIIVDALNRNAI